jgi:hypothetical protein
MPTPVRVSVGVLAGLAVLLLLSAMLTAVAWTAVVDAVAEARPGQPRSDAALVVRLNLLQSLLFGLLAAVSAVFLARRRGWARWLGLAAALLLGLITLGAVLLTGGIWVSSQLVLVLCAAAAVSLLHRATAGWAATGARGRSAA